MSTQTPLPVQRSSNSSSQSVVSSYPAAKAVVSAKGPVVTVPSPPTKAKPAGKTTPTMPSSSEMTIRARVEYEMDENGDLYRKAVYEANSSCAAAEIRPEPQPPVDSTQATAAPAAEESSEESEGEIGIVNEFNNAMNMAAAATKDSDYPFESRDYNFNYTYDETPVCQAGRHRSVALATEHTIPRLSKDEVRSRQIQAAVARVNNEGLPQNAMNAILEEQRRRFATRQWLSGNTSAAAAATTIPERTAEIDVVSAHATDGDSDDEIPVEACRLFKSILNAAQEQNQAQSALYGPVLTEEQQQALSDEEARIYLSLIHI